MTAITNQNHRVRTGRPLGLADVAGKLVETGLDWLKAYKVDRSIQTDAFAAAAELRRLAASHRKWSPGFAADLFAAADRHERDTAN